MENSEKIIVEGFEFSSKKEAMAAQKEADSIKYIKEKVKHDNSDKLLSMYNKLIEEKVFKTPIGISYLREIQQKLYRFGVSEEEMLPITFEVKSEEHEKQTVPVEDKKYKAPFITSVIINIAMVVVIIIMIYIATTTTSPTVLNYEEQIQNKYASWADSLSEREAELKSMEKEIEAKSKNSQN